MDKLLASSLVLVFLAASLFFTNGASFAADPPAQDSCQSSADKTAKPAKKKSKRRRRSKRASGQASGQGTGKRLITVKSPNKQLCPGPVKAAPAPSAPASATPAAPAAPAAQAAPTAPAAPTETRGSKVRVREVRHWSNAGYTRVVIDVDGPVTYTQQQIKNPDRLFLDIKNARMTPPLKDGPVSEINDGILKTIRASQYNHDTVRVVLDLASLADYKTLMLPDPPRLVVDVTGKEARAREARPRVITLRPVEQPGTAQPAQQQAAPPAVQAATQAAPAPLPNTSATTTAGATPPAGAATPMFGETTSVRPQTAASAQPAITGRAAPAQPETAAPKEAARPAVPMYCIGCIVIDPGHGGKDTGALGHGGLKEKDVVLDIGKRLRDLVRDQLGCKVVMTRDTDVFIDLDARPAKQKDADIFISIHANASRDKAARGIETYLLNTSKDRHIMELAARENMMDVDKMGDMGVILRDLVLDTKREGSLRLAHAVHGKLVDEMKGANNLLNNRDVKQGPFWVLYGAEMPSILTEVGFITNPEEEQLLGSPEYRQKLAAAIFDGIKDYINTSKTASTAQRPAISASSY